jgi:hypothetical protein
MSFSSTDVIPNLSLIPSFHTDLFLYGNKFILVQED